MCELTEAAIAVDRALAELEANRGMDVRTLQLKITGAVYELHTAKRLLEEHERGFCNEHQRRN